MDPKSIFRSKLNWLGAATVIAPFVDPVMQLIPAEYKPLAVSIVGLATIIVRTFFTKQPVAVRPE